jgi:hypothetical protein
MDFILFLYAFYYYDDDDFSCFERFQLSLYAEGILEKNDMPMWFILSFILKSCFDFKNLISIIHPSTHKANRHHINS